MSVIRNLTGKAVKIETDQGIRELPDEGHVTVVKDNTRVSTDEEFESVDGFIFKIDVVSETARAVIGLPDPHPGVFFLVEADIKLLLPHRHDLLVISTWRMDMEKSRLGEFESYLSSVARSTEPAEKTIPSLRFN